MKLVLVEWIDAGGGADGWTSKYDIDKEVKTVECISVGLCINDINDEYIQLIQNRNKACYLHGIAIPKSCIKRIRQLKIK